MAKYFTFKNQADATKPAEILIYGQIGKDWWTNDGVDAKEFADALKAIPTDQLINVHINSEGGNVWTGLAIYNLLKARRDKVTCYVDGICASAATYIALAGSKTVMPRNSLFMIHDPAGMCTGTAEDMEKMKETLNTHKKVIVSIYTEKTGKTEKEIAEAMTKETWFTGNEAKAFGFADEITEDAPAVVNIFNLTQFRRVPEALAAIAQPVAPSGAPQNKEPKNNRMDKAKILALLRQGGVKINDDATDEQILNELSKLKAHSHENAELSALKAQFENSQKALEKERTIRITNAVQKAVDEQRIPVDQKEAWVKRAVTDETILDDLSKMPRHLPGPAPLSGFIEIVSEDSKTVLNEFGKSQGMQRANLWVANRAKLLPILNGNTIDAALKRAAILQDVVMAAFPKLLAPFNAFSTKFENVKLEGTNVVTVPYFALSSTASTDFVAANGYVMGDNSWGKKSVTVDKRKYQPLRFTSDELARTPFLNVAGMVTQITNKLLCDVFADVLSVVTNANYGAASVTADAADFDSTDVGVLRGVANTANWPKMGRSLILDTAYDTNLMVDTSIKSASLAGSAEAIRNGGMPEQRILGFDYYECPNIPLNSEKLKGFICMKSGILIAAAPLEPSADVRAQLTKYEIFTDPTTGFSIEYRAWGNPDMDQTRQVLEVNYGYAVGEAAALKRICAST